MERLSSSGFPEHLVHPNATTTATVLVWALAGVVVTALGGLTATRAKGNHIRLIIGMALTLVGVAVVGSAVYYHNSLTQAAGTNWS